MRIIEVKTFGSDPEFCVVDENNNPVIVENHIPGSKKEPFHIKNGICIQPDGVSVEMTIAPQTDKASFVNTMLEAKNIAQELVSKINPKYKIQARSSATYDLEELQKHPNCLEFGCSVSFSTWQDGAQTYVPSAEVVGNLRSFGELIAV